MGLTMNYMKVWHKVIYSVWWQVIIVLALIQSLADHNKCFKWNQNFEWHCKTFELFELFGSVLKSCPLYTWM